MQAAIQHTVNKQHPLVTIQKVWSKGRSYSFLL